MRRVLIALFSMLGLLLVAPGAQAAHPHEVRNDPIVCVQNTNGTVTCSGSVAGLGNDVFVAQVDVDFACATRGNAKQPGGHLQGKSGPIQARNGRITFSVTTGPASCPPGLIPDIGDTATVTLFDSAGVAVFSKTVNIS